MRTLDEAWAWYERNRRLLRMMKRLGGRYWGELPEDGRLGKDDEFRSLDGPQVAGMAESVLAELDDLAVFVLFSVFEAMVRRAVAEDLQPEIDALQHPALRRNAAKLLQNIEEGSFHGNVLELFKRDGREPRNRFLNDLVEEVSRVRRYRNWVAHGRKVRDRPDRISPRDARETLQAFLEGIRRDVP